MRTIKPLTALRAFFALWVLTRHWFFLYPEFPTPFFDLGIPTPIFDRGYLGVDGFFVLSGFILAYTYAGKVAPISYQDFLINRIARIYPVHIACLAMAGARILAKQHLQHTQIVGTPGNTWWDLGLNLLLMNSWLPAQENGWNDVAWSVSAEWFAYLAFPAFMLLAKPCRPNALAPLVLISIAALWVLEQQNGTDHLSIAHGLTRIIPEFALGVLIYRLRDCTPLLARARIGSIAAISVVGLAVASGIDALAVAGLAGLILSLANERDILYRPMSARWLIYLGEISYCLYLVQRVPQNLWSLLRMKLPFFSSIPVQIEIPIFLLFCVTCAAILHHTIEIPARSAIKRAYSRFHSVEASPISTA